MGRSWMLYDPIGSCGAGALIWWLRWCVSNYEAGCPGFRLSNKIFELLRQTWCQVRYLNVCFSGLYETVLPVLVSARNAAKMPRKSWTSEAERDVRRMKLKVTAAWLTGSLHVVDPRPIITLLLLKTCKILFDLGLPVKTEIIWWEEERLNVNKVMMECLNGTKASNNML